MLKFHIYFNPFLQIIQEIAYKLSNTGGAFFKNSAPDPPERMTENAAHTAPGPAHNRNAFQNRSAFRKAAAGRMNPANRGVLVMSSRHSMMSDELKYEIAKELGVDDRVRSEGWGSVSSRDCGNMVRKAIELAERGISK